MGKSLIEKIEDLLIVTTLSESPKTIAKNINYPSNAGNVDICLYDGADIFINDILLDGSIGNSYLIPTTKSVTINDLKVPFNLKMLTNSNDFDNEIVLIHYKKADIKKWRGRMHFIAPNLIDVMAMFINVDNGCSYLKNDVYGYINGKKPVRCGPIAKTRATGNARKYLQYSATIDDRNNYSPLFVVPGIIAIREALWRTYIKFEDSLIGLTYNCDSVAVKDVFRFRDIPDGKKRRDALLHWVSGHYRKYREDPEAEMWVRDHIRGKTEFTWSGIQCIISPPKEKLENLYEIYDIPTEKMEQVTEQSTMLPNSII